MVSRLWKFLLIAPLAIVGMANAAGFSIYEQGGAAHAQAGAFAARADDPSAVFFNPAGIATQSAAISIGTSLIMPSTDFEGSAPFPGVGVAESMESQLFYPSHLYAVYPVSKVTLGFGFFTPFGLGTKWDDDYTGQYVSQEASIQTFYFNPVVAYNMGAFNFAAGIQAVKAKVEMRRNIYQAGVGTLAQLDLEGSNDLNYGWNVGTQWKPNEKLSVGLAFRSAVDTELEGDADFSGAGVTLGALPSTAKVSSNIEFPSIFSAGVAYQVMPKLTVEVDVLSMQWSSFDELPIDFAAPYSALSDTLPEDYEDSRSYRIGAEYDLNDAIDLRCGFLYDESPQPTESVSPLLPDADRWSIQLGVGYTTGPVTFDVGYMYLQFKDRSTGATNHTSYFGSYQSTAHLIGLTATYAF